MTGATPDPRDVASRPAQYTPLVRATSWFLLAFLGLLALGSLTTMVDPSFTPIRRVLGTSITTLVVAGFVIVQGRLLGSSRPRGTTVLAGVVVLLGLTLVPLSHTWALLGISVATAMLVTRRRWSFALGLLVWVVGVIEVTLDSRTWFVRSSIALAALLTAALQVTLTGLAIALTNAHTSREQLARLRVDDERHRISRDLHDIIGRALVAASLRNEAAQQLLDHDPERAREQLVQVHEAIAQGQAQLRRLTTGPVIANLPDELASAKALCARLDIRCTVDVVPVMDPSAGILAAMIVRESATNMLRHSSPRHCEITIAQKDGVVTVSVINDGASPAVPDTHRIRRNSSGTGLADLRSRVETIGGSFQTGWLDNERFRVSATLPCDPENPEDRP